MALSVRLEEERDEHVLISGWTQRVVTRAMRAERSLAHRFRSLGYLGRIGNGGQEGELLVRDEEAGAKGGTLIAISGT